MWFLVADPASTPAPSDSLIISIFTFLGVVVTTLGLIVVQYLKGRPDRTAASQPAPTSGTNDMADVKADLAVLKFRADTADEEKDYADRAMRSLRDDMDDVVRHLNQANPRWRD